MQDIVDLLQIRIEEAKAKLPAETVNAIATVDWRAAILGMREKKGYSFEQLGDLELETELLLCGLVSPTDYPRELETRMKISKAEANELVNIMNEQVFAKVRGEMIKNSERKKMFNKSREVREVVKADVRILDSAGIKVTDSSLPARTMDMRNEKPVEAREDVLKKVEKPEEIHPILTQKLSGAFKIPVVETDHSLKNLQPSSIQNVVAQKPSADPYREIPE